MKILLVQDNQIDRNLVEKSLREVAQFDHELTTCRSLGAALSRLAESTFDVVLLDLWLPDCQGAETCRRLIEQSPSTPVVVMTSEEDRSSAAQAIRYGARHSLVKGTDPGAAIASLLQIAIDRHRNERDVAQRESRLCQMLGHVPALIWTTGPDLSITGVAGRISDSLPLVPEHIIGLALDERLFHGMGHGSAGTDVSALIRAQRLAIEGQSGSVEFEWRGRTFEARIILCTTPIEMSKARSASRSM